MEKMQSFFSGYLFLSRSRSRRKKRSDPLPNSPRRLEGWRHSHGKKKGKKTPKRYVRELTVGNRIHRVVRPQRSNQRGVVWVREPRGSNQRGGLVAMRTHTKSTGCGFACGFADVYRVFSPIWLLPESRSNPEGLMTAFTSRSADVILFFYAMFRYDLVISHAASAYIPGRKIYAQNVE